MSWTIDPAHTMILFSAKHLGVATVRGKFQRFGGEIHLEDPTDPTVWRGRIEVETASLDTGNDQRDAHLRSSDFFDVEKHPTIIVEAKSVTEVDDAYKVVADITIKGITNEVTLDYEHNGTVLDPYGNTKVGGTLTGTINRTDWGLVWNVPLGGGGWLVSEKIKLEVDGELAESKAAVADAEMIEGKVG